MTYFFVQGFGLIPDLVAQQNFFKHGLYLRHQNAEINLLFYTYLA